MTPTHFMFALLDWEVRLMDFRMYPAALVKLEIGVRDLVARGYFIPGGASQRGGGQAPMFPCRTLSDLDYPGLRSVTCDVSSRWVLTTVQ